MRDQQPMEGSASTGPAPGPKPLQAAHIGDAMLQALGGLDHPLAHLPIDGLIGVINGWAALAQSDDIRLHGGWDPATAPGDADDPAAKTQPTTLEVQAGGGDVTAEPATEPASDPAAEPAANTR